MCLDEVFQSLSLFDSLCLVKRNDDKQNPKVQVATFDRLFGVKGGVGRLLFKEYVVPYLTLDDLVQGSYVSRSMNTMCRTYTIDDILAMKSMSSLFTYYKRTIGNFIMFVVDSKYQSSEQPYPSRKSQGVFGQDAKFRQVRLRARLYHPSSLEEMLRATLFCLERFGILFYREFFDQSLSEMPQNTDNGIPKLISAEFGPDSVGRRHIVTNIIRYLLLTQGNDQLVFKREPHYPWRWYRRFFDIEEGNSKRRNYLYITFRKDNKTFQRVYREDEEFSLPLRTDSFL